jgi:hypothetical protein
MTIETAGGFILVRFAPEDFQRKPGAYQFIAGMKERIGHYSKNPEGFDFDDKEKRWYIADTEQNRRVIEEIREMCFVDPDQINMFGDSSG